MFFESPFHGYPTCLIFAHVVSWSTALWTARTTRRRRPGRYQHTSRFKTGCLPLQSHLWSPLGLSYSFPQAMELSPGLIFFINLVNMLPPLLVSVTTIIFFTKSRSANPLTPEQRIMAMREKSQMALAQIVKLTAGESCNFFKPTVVQINWTVNSFQKVWQPGWREWVL